MSTFARAPENRRGRPTTLAPSHPAAIRLDRLHRALLNPHGYGESAVWAREDRLDEARWLAFGVPIHTVRVGSRVYAVSSDHDEEFDLGTGAYGFAAINVIEL